MEYLCFVILLAVCNNVEMVIVKVNDGLLDGKIEESTSTQKEFYSFQGIPYAVPPVGELRFRDPVPHGPWKGVRPAKEHGDECIQFNDFTKFYLFGTEDCLFLNVYTPTLSPLELLAVIFFIHGGAFKFGSGDERLYGPDYLLANNVVVVTINYRLDALGFLNLGIKEVPGNAGLKDQRLALKWVHDNIHHFGGDPKQVTLMGESAGSTSVIYHMMSPMSKGLFHRAIAQSGVPMCEWALTYKPVERSAKLAEDLGANTLDRHKMLKHLQSLPAVFLINQFPIVIPEEIYWRYQLKMTAFQPCAEKDFGHERFLVETPLESLKKGAINPVDLLIGYTSEEGLIVVPDIITKNLVHKYNRMPELFIPREIWLHGTRANSLLLETEIRNKYFSAGDIGLTSIRRFIRYMSDEVFVYNINRFIKHLPINIKKYVYKFSAVTPRNRLTIFGLPFGVKGVAHTDDLAFIFKSDIPHLSSPDDKIIIKNTVTLLTNFVKYGNPTPDLSLGVVWPKYDNVLKPYININRTLSVEFDADSDVNLFWTHIYEKGLVQLP